MQCFNLSEGSLRDWSLCDLIWSRQLKVAQLRYQVNWIPGGSSHGSKKLQGDYRPEAREYWLRNTVEQLRKALWRSRGETPRKIRTFKSSHIYRRIRKKHTHAGSGKSTHSHWTYWIRTLKHLLYMLKELKENMDKELKDIRNIICKQWQYQ